MQDQAFQGAGRKEGIEGWRVENLSPVRLQEVDGKLYSGKRRVVGSLGQTLLSGRCNESLTASSRFPSR